MVLALASLPAAPDGILGSKANSHTNASQRMPRRASTIARNYLTISYNNLVSMSLNGPEEILTNVVSISAEAWLITGSSHAATAVSTYATAARAVFSCRLSLSTLTMSGKLSKLAPS